MTDTPGPVPSAPGPEVERATVEDLIAAARALVVSGRRTVLGITGSPGAGKSTIAELIVAALGSDAVLVGMDGFHLSDTELRRLGRWERKGASDTFDAAGYVHLLRRLRSREDAVVYAPTFDRALEESIGSAVPVPADIPLVVTEGNYLLSDLPAWHAVAGLLDECWFVQPSEAVRVERLVARHLRFGRTLAEALERTHGSDGRNADLVSQTRARATRVIEVPEIVPRAAAPGPGPTQA
ncbi:MAG: fructose transport system kinase [Friedmanniella sp.]|nr:fructose transport system kinase [Friedmanniella sp.]